MSHNAEHIVVNIATPVKVGGVKTRGWVVAAALASVGFALGALLF